MSRFAVPDAQSAAWPAIAAALLLLVQATMVFTRAINWDEFYHFGTLIDLARGAPVGTLQSFYYWPFVWIADLPGNAVDRIVMARIGMFACECAILAAIFVLARRFSGRESAALAVLAYVSAGYVLQHGFAFRADPMVTAALMWSLVVLTHRPRTAAAPVLAGALAGLAMMLSIKAVLYAPVFAGLAWWRLLQAQFERRAAAGLALGALAAIATFGVLYGAHALLIASDGNSLAEGTRGATGLATSAARHMFFIGLPNNRSMMVGFVFIALGLTALIVLAPYAIYRRSATRAEKIALAALWSPILTLFYYENTASYYYVFMLAPVCAACAASIDLLRTKVPTVIITAVLISLIVPALVLENRTVIGRQRALIAEVDRLFPHRAAYFDHADMLGHFDKQNGFLTPWGLDSYRTGGKPTYRAAMERETIPLLLANWPVFHEVLSGEDTFLPADGDALRRNYLHFEGPIWLAGKNIDPANGVAREEFLVPGPYTVRDGPVSLDGETHPVGAVVEITRGQHELSATGGPARLIWGHNLVPRGGDALRGATWVRF